MNQKKKKRKKKSNFWARTPFLEFLADFQNPNFQKLPKLDCKWNYRKRNITVRYTIDMRLIGMVLAFKMAKKWPIYQLFEFSNAPKNFFALRAFTNYSIKFRIYLNKTLFLRKKNIVIACSTQKLHVFLLCFSLFFVMSN